MANIQRNFIAGRMNKTTDKRLIPNGEYIDALNIRLGSTETSEVGTVQNSRGNIKIATLQYNGTQLSADAKCIGAYEDGANETLYWLIHDPSFESSPTGKIDLICSFETSQSALKYHVISINDGDDINTTLNFNSQYLVTGIDLIGDLLFFTDDYNPPRRININPIPTQAYGNPVAGVDGFSAESILVIKKPPIQSPTVSLINTNNQENFLDTRFICFAYRYLYQDNEYSATSQFSDVAFIPSPFEISTSSYLNVGMLNAFNAARVTFNTGGPLVVGIDLLFKESNSNVIKVIKKLSKKNLGYDDDINITYTFDNSEIFTILPDSEILRLYDNVPRFAKAQTIMGNRLMYGNYVDGYNLVDLNLEPIKLEYSTEVISNEIGNVQLIDSTSNGDYSIDGTTVVPSATINIDLGDNELVEGAIISIAVTFSHYSFSGSPQPTETTEDVEIAFSFLLPNTYTSVYQLANSEDFINAIGTIANIKPVSTACDGITFTDTFNCIIPNTLTGDPNSFTKTASGITAVGQPVNIKSSPASTIIGLQLPAMEYTANLTLTKVYEYYKVTFISAQYQKIANAQSLHSNRGYEVGIVYMDEFNRSSTALLSPQSTEHIPCSSAEFQNQIQVTIPFEQRAPYWATRYKFVIKPDTEGYDTIYSNIFFEDPDSNDVYFLLEGENSFKIEVGDELIVKADTNGPMQTCAYTTVLEKSAQISGFLKIPDILDPSKNLQIPAGVYMKINPNNFETTKDPDAVIEPGTYGSDYSYESGFEYPFQSYPMNKAGTDPAHSSWTYIDYTVPAGTFVTMNIEFYRQGTRDGNTKCERRIYTLKKTFLSSGSYDNMFDWFNGENIQASLDNGIWEGGGGAPEPYNVYDDTLSSTIFPSEPYDINDGLEGTNYYRFHRDTTTNELTLMIKSGTPRCRWTGRATRASSRITTTFQIFRATDTIIFETHPKDALPDVFFEGSQSFEINALGEHQGNIQNQVFSTYQSAIVDTGLFNCFTFGNGAESYKIQDSITGKAFNLGERVTSTAAQDYKEADRYADITYSGIYNEESNVNKLNEFNLGLLNYKSCEVSFGPIQKLYARETDILTLQEDKISYVLTGKNLLSDASGGSALTSVPEVLGTQIARVEEFGISMNPESFSVYGYDKYFTDAKRGAVIQLKGGNTGQDQLVVISDMGMRTWFRDLFNQSFDTQKLGGYDPYMNEYVLSSNEILLPQNIECESCGVVKTYYTITAGDNLTYCTNFGSSVGNVNIVYNINSVEEFVNIQVVYNGILYETGDVTTSGVLSFNKNLVSVRTAQVTVISSSGLVSIDMTEECPDALDLTVVQVCLTSNVDAGQFIHNQYRYIDGTYIGPLLSTSVEFDSGAVSPIVSQYQLGTNNQGTGSCPTDGSNVTMLCNKINFDDFVFDVANDSFKYLRTSTLYENNPTDINNLLSAAITATPIITTGAPNVYSSEFIMPTSTDNYLYLIYDYRNSVPIELCYSATSLSESCCDCTFPVDAATLTFTTYAGGQFRFDLDVPISVDLIVQGATVTGYSDVDCSLVSVAFDTISSANQLTILAGDTTGLQLGQTPMDCLVNKYRKLNLISMYGTNLYNGDTIVVSGVTITIVIDDSCMTYAC